MGCYFCKKPIPYELIKDNRAIKILDGKGQIAVAHGPCVAINDLALPRYQKPYRPYSMETLLK